MEQPQERRLTNSVSNVMHLRSGLPSAYSLGQSSHRLTDLLVDGLPNRGQRHARITRELGVVETRKRDLPRHIDGATVELVQDTERHQVIGADDRVDLVRSKTALVEQRRHRAPCRFHA
jgi:hypothetical protein